MATATKKKSTTPKKRSSTTGTAKKKAATSRKAAPRLHEREPQLLVKDTAFVLAGVADEAVSFARELPAKLRTDSPVKLRELRIDPTQRSRYEAQLRDLRARAAKEADSRLQRFEQRFDQRAEAGAKVVDRLRKDERVAAVEEQLGRVFEQSGNTRTHLKAAITSVRKTVETALVAGRAQADTAKSQVKAAVTSSRRTAETVTDAGEQLAS